MDDPIIENPPIEVVEVEGENMRITTTTEKIVTIQSLEVERELLINQLTNVQRRLDDVNNKLSLIQGE